MHSRSGWPPVFNALFVGTSVLLLMATVQPGTLPIQNSFEFLASVAGQPPMMIPANHARHLASDSIANISGTMRSTTGELIASSTSEPLGIEPASPMPAIQNDKVETRMFPVSCVVKRDDEINSTNHDLAPENHLRKSQAEIAIQEIKPHFSFEGALASTTIGRQTEVPTSQPDSHPVPATVVSLSDEPDSADASDADESETDSMSSEKPKPVLDKRRDRQSRDRSRLQWPSPEALVTQIETLRKMEATRAWADNTIKLIELMADAESLADPMLTTIFGQLESQRRSLAGLTARLSTVPTRDYRESQGPQAAELLRVDYSLTRRLAVWRLVHQLAREQDSGLVNRGQAVKITQASVRNIPWHVHPEWREYLLVDEAEPVFKSLNPNGQEQTRVARKVLARVNSPALTMPQQQFAMSAFEPELYQLLKTKAASELDLHALLEYMEKQEQDGSGLTEYKVNDEYQNLLWSDNRVAQQLAEVLDTHYRNANFRVSVSEKFVNRLIPETPATAEPISERIMGAQVFGQNHIQNQMGVEFIPDPNHIQMQIVTVGEVRSNTRASKSGFTIDNRGTARFQAFKRLAFGRHGVSSDQAVAASSADQQVVGMSSRLDPIPLVGWVARRIARQKIEEEKPRAEQVFRQRVESTVYQRMQHEVETGLNQIRLYLDENIYQPLVAMDLEPEAVEMSTSNDRLVMRYRLAGRDQMAANTARPRAVTDSLLSMQIHESAINNLLMRIELGGRTFNSQELRDHLKQRIGANISGGDGIEHEATFEFSYFDPIRVDFENKRVQFSINLKSFKVGENGKTWRNLTASTTYLPQVQGRKIVLVQDQGEMKLQGKGLKLRDQIAIRGIFEALFDESYTLSPLPASLIERISSPDLQISQLDVEDGWIGISISEPPGHHEAEQSGLGLLRRRR